MKNRLNMYRTVLSVMREYEPLWASSPLLPDVVNRLEAGVQNIEANFLLNATAVQGVYARKNAAFAEIAEEMIQLHDTLWIYAYANNLFDLIERNKVAPSVVRRLNNSSRLMKMEALINDLDNHSSSLESFGITTERIESFRSKVMAYRVIESDPRKAVADRKAKGAELERYSREIGVMIREELDRLVRQYAATQPMFVLTYFNARIIVDQNTRRNRSNGSRGEPEELI